MDNYISYEEAAALRANPPSLVPCPNFTNLRNLRRHIQRAFQRLSCPQSNILGWAGHIMARSMYILLTTSPFRLPSDPGQMAVYYPPPVEIVDAQGDPVLDLAGNPTYHDPPDIPSERDARRRNFRETGKEFWFVSRESYYFFPAKPHSVTSFFGRRLVDFTCRNRSMVRMVPTL